MKKKVMAQVLASFSDDVAIAAWKFQDFHPQSTRVVINPETHEIVSLCVNRPSHSVKETKNIIEIPFGSEEYKKLNHVKSTTHPPFPVYAWDINTTRGHSRGMFRIEKHGDKQKFILHRIPHALCLDAETRSAVVNALEPTPPSSPSTSSTTSSAPAPAPAPAPPPSSSSSRARDPARFGLPTTFNHVTYRSRKEARFAFALHALNITFVYEPMVFSRPQGGKYMPDFFLPQQQLWVELKPQRPHLEEELKCEEMSASGFRVVLMYGEKIECLPFRTEATAKRESGSRDYKHKDGLRGMAWIDGEKLAGDTVFVMGGNPRGHSALELCGPTDQPHLDQVSSTRDMRWNTNVIENALIRAGQEKFE